MVQKEQISRKTEEEEAQKWRVWLRGGTYVFGMLVLAMGLTLNTKAELGVSPIISVPYSLSQIFSLDFGNTTLVFYILFVLVQIALHRGKAIWKDLLQVPLAIVFTRFLNLYAAWLPEGPTVLWQQLLVLLMAFLCTGVGAAMTVNAHLVPNPGDGIVAALGETIHRPMGFAKNVFDLCNACITLIIGFICGQLMVGIGVGTLLAVIVVGRVIALYNHFVRLHF